MIIATLDIDAYTAWYKEKVEGGLVFIRTEDVKNGVKILSEPYDNGHLEPGCHIGTLDNKAGVMFCPVRFLTNIRKKDSL